MSGAYGWCIDSTREFIRQESESDLSRMTKPFSVGLLDESVTPAEDPENDKQLLTHSCSIMGYYWCEASGGVVPAGAVKAGVDKDGGEIFVGRAIHEGEIIPAKITPNYGCAFVAYGGGDHRKDEYEVLCKGNCMVMWQECENGVIPGGAVAVGRTKEDERLYIGRVFHDGTHTPGKVQPSHGVCYIPYDGQELSFSTYEVLILQ